MLQLFWFVKSFYMCMKIHTKCILLSSSYTAYFCNLKFKNTVLKDNSIWYFDTHSQKLHFTGKMSYILYIYFLHKKYNNILIKIHVVFRSPGFHCCYRNGNSTELHHLYLLNEGHGKMKSKFSLLGVMIWKYNWQGQSLLTVLIPKLYFMLFVYLRNIFL